MENKQPTKVSTVLFIALAFFWPVMLYLGYKVGKIKFYIMIVVITNIIPTGLFYLGVPWYVVIPINYGFYWYFAFRLIKQLKNS